MFGKGCKVGRNVFGQPARGLGSDGLDVFTSIGSHKHRFPARLVAPSDFTWMCVCRV